jgi:hypothetical protein
LSTAIDGSIRGREVRVSRGIQYWRWCRRLIAVAAAVIALASTLPRPAIAGDAGPIAPSVKKSKRGICHVRGSQGYEQTLNFTAFQSLEACLAAGGRLPGSKGGTGAKDDKALYDSDDRIVVRKSRSGICHDPSSPSYTQTKNYTAYATMDDCLASGGRRPAGNR